MTGPSVPYRIPGPAPVPGGPQATASRTPELCTRCGAVGTHYLTCPGLRLPSGYRLGDAPRPGKH